MSDQKWKSATGMLLDGIFGSEAIDSSGEILDIEGADISDLEEGKGVFNWEHRGEDSDGASPNDVVGKIIYAKKIFKESDCENDREKGYWNQVKMPFIYGVGRLYDAAGHPGAVALAAQIRDHHANGEPILARFSVEGSTLEKKDNRLLRSVIRRVAITLKPCNKTAHSGLLADPNAPKGFEQKPEADAEDLLAVKTKKFEHPNFLRLGASFETEILPLESLSKSLARGVLDSHLAEWGWKFFRSKKHDQYSHDGIPEGRLSLSHDQAHTVPDNKLHWVMKDAGLKWNQDSSGFIPDPKHKFYSRYQELGYAPKTESTIKTWQPIESPLGEPQSIEIDKLTPTQEVHPQDWKHLKHRNDFQNNRPVPAITAMDGGDGTFWVDEGNEILSAAKAHGMTHVPTIIKKSDGDIQTLVKSLAKLKLLEKIHKAISAGTGAGVAAPSALASDEALKKMKSSFMAAVRDYSEPFNKTEFKQFLKHYLPETDDQYLDRFADLAETLKLKKAEGLIKGDLIDLKPSSSTGKNKRKNAEVLQIPTEANTIWDAPGTPDHNQFVNPKLTNRARAGNIPDFEEPKLVARGVGTNNNVYDYTHHLDPIAQQNGYTMTISHTPGKGDDFMLARVHNKLGQTVKQTFAYPSTITSGGNPDHKHMWSAIKNHQNWIKYGEHQKSESEDIGEELEKGQNGDWKKEGYSIKYFPPAGKSGPSALHTVIAYDKEGKTVGKLSAEDTGDGTCQACVVKVNPEHQRKGLATSMYETLERKAKLRVTPDLEAQTDDAAALWAQKKRNFGKSEALEKADASKSIKVNDKRRFDAKGNAKQKEAGVASTKAPATKAKALKTKEPESEPKKSTVRGVPLTANPNIGGNRKGMVRPHLEDRGDKAILHLPIGSFPMYNPNNPHKLHQSGGKDLELLKDIYNSPKMREKHDRAMENYFKIESLCRQKKLPEEAVMHAVMFSVFSANSPVWNHELKYSRTNDLMNEYGITPMSSDFGNLKDRFLDSDSPFDLPKHSKQYFEKMPEMSLDNDTFVTVRQGGKQIRVKDSEGNFLIDRLKGQIPKMQLAPDQFDHLSEYHMGHKAYVDALAKYGADGRSAVSELMDAKNKKKLKLSGIANKTARFAFSMLGAGNLWIPDTHAVRHMLGLEHGKDGSTIEYIKRFLWQERNHHVLNDIDNWMAKNHPAVQEMLNHPKWGKYLNGDAQRALFPAFWLNWGAITHHEEARGYNTEEAHNSYADHTPYWDAMDKILKSEEETPEAKAFRTAKLHAQWVAQYGELPALQMYFEHIVPKFLEAAQKKENKSKILKAQALSIEMKKAESEIKKPQEPWIVRPEDGLPGANYEPEQQALVNGQDFSNLDPAKTPWHPLNNGKHVYVKGYLKGNMLDTVRQEAAFYNAAKNVFNLAQYTPVATALKHPHDEGREFSVVEGIPDAQHISTDKSGKPLDKHAEILSNLGQKGELDKMMLMDLIMGNTDRHLYNMVFSEQKPHFHLIDHSELDGLTMMTKPYKDPAYLHHYSKLTGIPWRDEQFHPSAAHWLQRINLKKLATSLYRSGLPRNALKESLRRLWAVKDHLRKMGAKTTRGSIHDAPFEDENVG